MPVRALYGKESFFHILQDLYIACAGPTSMPYSALMDSKWISHNYKLQNSHTGIICGHMGLYGPHMGCLKAVYDL